jgi:hypothetical protein
MSSRVNGIGHHGGGPARHVCRRLATDIVTENAAGGTDLVTASITYALGANLENLTLTGSSAITVPATRLPTGHRNAATMSLDGASGSDTLRAASATTLMSSTSQPTS